MDNAIFFISHAGAQRKLAYAVDKLLTANNISGFLYERDFPRDSDFVHEIALHLNSTSCTIALLTPAFLNSKWCMKELLIAHSANKLIPVIIEDCDISKLPVIDNYIDLKEFTVAEAIEKIDNLIKDETLFETINPKELDFSEVAEIVGSITVAISRFEPIDDSENNWRTSINELYEDFKNVPYLKFVELDQIAGSKEEAARILEETGTDILLWGTQEEGILQIGSVFSKGWEFPLAASQNINNELLITCGVDEIELGHLRYTLEFALGCLELARNRPNEALARLDKADDQAAELMPVKSLDGTRIFAKDFDLGTLYLRTAEAYRAVGEFSMALENFRVAIAYDPENALIYNNRGVIFDIALGDFNAALKDYNHAIALDSTLAVAYYNRGHLYERAGNLEKATQDYSMAIDLGQDPVAYYRRGQLHYGKGELQLALNDVNSCLAVTPNFEYAYSFRGVIYESLGKFNDAVQSYSTALELNPDFIEGLYNRGGLLFTIGEHQLARVDYNRFLNLAKENGIDFIESKGIGRNMVLEIALRVNLINSELGFDDGEEIDRS